MLEKLKIKAKQMASALKESKSSESLRDHLLGTETRCVSESNRTDDLENFALQRRLQILAEQSEALRQLEATGKALGAALDLHDEALLDSSHLPAGSANSHRQGYSRQWADAVDSRLQRAEERLATLERLTMAGILFMCLILIVVLVVVICIRFKHL